MKNGLEKTISRFLCICIQWLPLKMIYSYSVRSELLFYYLGTIALVLIFVLISPIVAHKNLTSSSIRSGIAGRSTGSMVVFGITFSH